MKSQYQKQFLSQQKIQHKVLKALTQKKYEIRVNFSQSKAFKLLQTEIKNESQQRSTYQMDKNRQNNNQEGKSSLENNHFQSITLSNRRGSNLHDNLLEIIKRQNNKLAPMGWHQERQFSRSNQMSRTYRRKRQNSKMRDVHKTLQIDKRTAQIQPKLTQQYFYKANPSFTQFHKNQLKKVVWINEPLKSANQTQNLLPIRNTTNKSLMQSGIFSKRSNSVLSPSLMRQKLATINEYHQQYEKIQSNQQKNQFQRQNKHSINFLQLKKPAYSTLRKKITSMSKVRNKSQRSRGSESINQAIRVSEDSCRPWTSRNVQEKGEEGKQAQLLQ